MKVVSLLALCCCALLSHTPAQAEEQRAAVEVVKATLTRVAPRRWVPGNIVSRNDARLATSAAGRLEYVAEVGTNVRAGDRIAKLEDTALNLRVADTQADIARIEAQRGAAERQLQRLEKLGSNSISQTQLDEMRSQLSMLTAQLQQAEVRHKLALHELAQTEVRAPFPGVVTERYSQHGEYVSAGAAIAHLVDTVHLEARVQAPLALLDWVKPAMLLPLKSGQRQLQANVRAIVPVGTERSRQFELRLTLERPPLAVGSAIEVGLPESAATESLVVPRDAIAIRQDGSYLMRVGAAGTTERVAVTTSTAEGDQVVVHGAVKAGDTIIVRGMERLQPGERVRIINRNTE